jgi:hypothetical protein
VLEHTDQRKQYLFAVRHGGRAPSRSHLLGGHAPSPYRSAISCVALTGGGGYHRGEVGDGVDLPSPPRGRPWRRVGQGYRVGRRSLGRFIVRRCSAGGVRPDPGRPRGEPGRRRRGGHGGRRSGAASCGAAARASGRRTKGGIERE